MKISSRTQNPLEEIKLVHGDDQKIFKQYVVSVGEAFFDMIADQKDTPREKVKSWTPKIGGAPTNLCVGFRKLGAETFLVSNIGKDEAGDKIIKFFYDKHIRITNVQRSDHPTRDVLTLMSSDGVPNFSGFSKPADSYADCFLDKEKIEFDLLNNASILATGTLGLAYPKSREALHYAVGVVNDKNDVCVMKDGYLCIISKVFVDINWRPAFFPDSSTARCTILEYVKKVDYIKVTTEEAAWLFDIEEDKIFKNPSLAFEQLPRLNLILLTAGEKGAWYAYRNQIDGNVFQQYQKAFPIKVADTAGAGDSFNSGFFTYLLRTNFINEFTTLEKKVWDNALKFATACSAITCTGQGAIDSQPTWKEVEDFLKQQNVALA